MRVSKAEPACVYHPIKVIFLDESYELLNDLDLEFGNQMNKITLKSPHTNLQKIEQNHTDNLHTIFEFENAINTDNTSTYLVNFEINNVLNLLYDRDRFNQVSILVFDGEMLGMDEMELFRKLPGKKIFKIMLSEERDLDKVIRAFNSGFIDRWIYKNSDNLYLEINQAIQELTQRYFKELTWNSFHAHNPAIKALFANELYQQLFSEVAKQANAVEYYLVDQSGSILFLDKDANPTWLIVKHVQEINEQRDLLMGYELPEHFIDSVAKKEKILFLFSEKEYKKHADEWVEYLYNSQQLDENYYYSVIQEPITDSIDWGRVVSYSAYREDAVLG